MNISIKSMDDMVDVAETLGWSIHCHGQKTEIVIEFEQHSPAGEDFIFSVQADKDTSGITPTVLEKLCEEVSAYSASFDTEEHIKMLLDAKAYGFAGVPSVKELVEDADAIQHMLRELAEALLYGKLEKKHIYEVTVSRTGVAFVCATSESAAMELADHLKTDEISWSDDWASTDAKIDEDYDGAPYTEPSF